MKIVLEIEGDAEAMFALHLAQRDGGAFEIADYFLGLHWANEELHPDTRYCSDKKCGEKVIPACTVAARKYVPNPFFRCAVSTRPVEVCPDCGAKTVTVEEHLNTVDCCTTWIASMRARLAAERAFPPRREGEPFGKEPAPMIRVVAEPAGKGGSPKPRAARKAKPKSVAGVRVFV